jgi:hypothetical protein
LRENEQNQVDLIKQAKTNLKELEKEVRGKWFKK